MKELYFETKSDDAQQIQANRRRERQKTRWKELVELCKLRTIQTSDRGQSGRWKFESIPMTLDAGKSLRTKRRSWI